MAEQMPTCADSAQALPKLMNELKTVLDCTVLDNGGVVVALLPKHRCGAGNYEGAESKENKHNSGKIESQEGGVKPQDHKHILEGLWENTGEGKCLVLVETVQDKPGYLLGTSLTKDYFCLPPKVPIFWFRIGDGTSSVLEGKFRYNDTSREYRHTGWVAENLYWHSNDEFAISRNNSRIRPMDNAVYKRFPAAKVWNFPIN